MEFEGRIIRVLPTRGGTSQRGNEWKALPFVFNQMAQIAQYCEIGADHKVIVENGSVKLKTLDIKCKCGFSHNVKDVARRDGSGTATLNEMRCYKLEIIGQTQQPAPAPQYQQQPGNVLGGPQTPPYNPHMPFPPQVDAQGNPIHQNDDDLPF